MSIQRKRKLLAAVLAVGSGMVFQYQPHGCIDYGVQTVATSFNFCSVINCTGSTYFDPCGTNPILKDCPNAP